MIGGHAIAAEQSKVFHIGGQLALFSVDQIPETDLARGFARDAVADHEGLTRLWRGDHFQL